MNSIAINCQKSKNAKSLITEPTFTCRSMHNNPYEQKNTSNIFITTNYNPQQFSQSHISRKLFDMDESKRTDLD